MLGVKNAPTIQKLTDMLELDTSEHVRILVSNGKKTKMGIPGIDFGSWVVSSWSKLFIIWRQTTKTVLHAFGNLEKTSSIYQ